MDYLFLKLWPYLLPALALGGFWGWHTCLGSRPRKDR